MAVIHLFPSVPNMLRDFADEMECEDANDADGCVIIRRYVNGDETSYTMTVLGDLTRSDAFLALAVAQDSVLREGL